MLKVILYNIGIRNERAKKMIILKFHICHLHNIHFIFCLHRISKIQDGNAKSIITIYMFGRKIPEK